MLAFIGGAALGATLGILFAPDKGVRTRVRIGKAARNAKDTVVEKLEDLVESAEDLVDDLKNKAESFIEQEPEEIKPTRKTTTRKAKA